MTVAEMLEEIYPLVHEISAAFPSGLWTPDEVIQYIAAGESDFMLATGLHKTVAEQTTTSAQPLYTEPSNCMRLERVALSKIPLLKTTAIHLEKANPEWKSLSGVPDSYHQDRLPLSSGVRQFQLNKKPDAGLTIEQVFITKPTDVSTTSSTLNLSPPFTLYVKLYVLYRMFSKPGEGQDPKKARYCRQRYQFGVTITRNLVEGKIL